MPGEKNLDILLKTMKPTVMEGDYVFSSLPKGLNIQNLNIISYFRESEGISVVVLKTDADRLNLTYNFIASWITLTVYSSLEAVGLTAAIAKALADARISCNVIAAYYHDHIFVDKNDCEQAVKILENLSK